MKKYIQKLLGIDLLIKEQQETNRLLSDLVRLTNAYNKAYHIN